jgi:pimeloyl-ACP methyl ester carboxylesterase
MPKMDIESSEQSPVAYSEEWVQVDGRRVRFWRAGSGLALVLVHGLLGYSFSWRHVIPQLALTWEVFAPDMPGSGFSECDSKIDCRLSSAANRLLKFLDAAGISSCDLVGSSYGGATALMLAANHPLRVRRLVLVSPANPWSKYGRKRMALLRNTAIASAFPKLARQMRPLHNYFLRRLYGEPSLITAETCRGYSDPLSRAGRFEHALGIVSSWNADMQELRAAIPKASNIPTLLIWGSRDRAVDPVSANALRSSFRTCHIEVIEGAGHLPYEECPKEFIRVITKFLKTPVPLGK